MTYQEILNIKIESNVWMEEDKLLSIVVKEKYKITKASQAKKNGVLNLLKEGHKIGNYIRGIGKEDGKIYWSKGNGEVGKVVLVDSGETIELESSLALLNRAKINIAKLETFLQELCSNTLEKQYGEDWEDRLGIRDQESMIKTLQSIKNNPWSVGEMPQILDLATFDIFAAIINAGWNDVFSKIFTNKWLTVSKLQELNYYRNAIQHNNPLSIKELIYFNTSVELFLEKFNKK
jgi:hypothetical protein